MVRRGTWVDTGVDPYECALAFLGAQASSLFVGPGCQSLTFPILAGPLAPSLTSGSVFLQAFVPHSTVAWGFASTNGLRIDIQ